METTKISMMRIDEVIKKCGLGRTTIYSLIKKGQFPSPVKVGRLSLFPDREINDWIEIKIQERGANAAAEHTTNGA